MAKSGNPRDNRNRKGRSIPNHNDPDVLLKRQAIGIAAFGTAEEYKDVPKVRSSSRRKKSATLPSYAEIAAGYEGYTNPLFDGLDVIEEEEYEESADFGPGWEDIDAPTTKEEHPRALAAAYHRGGELLVILFRDGTYILYEDVPLNMWEDLKSTDSTGRWILSSGLNSHSFYKTSIAGAKAKADSFSSRK